MDATAHYRHLIALGRDEFLAAAAPAALVRHRAPIAAPPAGDPSDETLTHGKFSLEDLALDVEVFPLVKKPGASFPDRITIGRTTNNDVVIADGSVSRLHAYIKGGRDRWVVADAGSKNGSTLRGQPLEPRREQPIASRAVLRLGDVDLTFYRADDLFSVLEGLR